ncbi:RIP metalloprotease RseP [Eubacterium minutum ATCC 700079]|nr:RIP metalloprotease RseP [Eubacterium minutum ATCC 700079]
MLTVILGILLFLFLIFPHELGHFLMARAVGVKVNEFAFGMGPAIWKKQGKETLYSVRLLPVGGYCAMEGEDKDSDDERAFNKKSPGAKILVLAAGAAMNVLIAVVVMSGIMFATGEATNVINKVVKDSPAAAAGIEHGDRIVDAGGKKIGNWYDFHESMRGQKKPFKLTVERKGERKTFSVTPKEEKGRYVIGVSAVVEKNLFKSVARGAKSTWILTGRMYAGLKDLVTGKVAVKEVTGPVGMIGLVHQTTSRGLTPFFYLLVFISLNLAIFNLLPFPALDGGRIIFVIIRMVTGKAITDRQENMVHGAGMILLLTLMVFATWNDLVRLFR